MLRAFLYGVCMNTPPKDLPHHSTFGGAGNYHICDDGCAPRMHQARYEQLMQGYDTLADYEVQQGWHFCPDHHEMLVVTGIAPNCTCPTAAEIKAFVEAEAARQHKMTELGIAAKYAPQVINELRESYIVKQDDGSIGGVIYENQE